MQQRSNLIHSQVRHFNRPSPLLFALFLANMLLRVFCGVLLRSQQLALTT